MPIDFPIPTFVGETFSAGGKTWMWNGYGWEAVTITAVGATGSTGPQGATGMGATGDVGPQGSTGPQGATGVQGATGDIGSTGSTGPQGATGVQGAMGDIGATGATGLQGATGADGATGASGAEGDRYHTTSNTVLDIVSTGTITLTTNDLNLDYSIEQSVIVAYSAGQHMHGRVSSYNPSTGVLVLSVTDSAGSGTGLSPWEVNLDGAVGIQGATGATGLAGATGTAGATGATGDHGATGNAGATGDIGSTGATGVIGATGIQGATGDVGPQGSTGLQGSTGIGATGDIGGTGATGPEGSTGPAGIGSAGSTGATGVQGIQGATGATGSTGATGIQGNQGTTGATGIGSTGATGLTGATGPAGAGGSITPGTIDNAVLRADGTGGTLLQNSDILIDDATTSTQNNVAIRNNHQGQTNSSLVLTPEGTGAFILGPKPDGTATGGNARGENSVDLQLNRTVNTQIASGIYSFTAGARNTATNQASVALGHSNSSSNFASLALGAANSATGRSSLALGGNNTASGSYGIALGQFCNSSALGDISEGLNGVAIGSQSTASANCTIALGVNSVSDRYGMYSHASGRLGTNIGDAQRARFVLRNKTTTNSAVELFLDGSSTRLTVPSGKIIALTINIAGVSSTGAAVAHYMRQYCLKNVAGTTTQVYSPITIGTDNAAGTSIALSASDASDALVVSVTGTDSTIWRWVASVDAVEISYGT